MRASPYVSEIEDKLEKHDYSQSCSALAKANAGPSRAEAIASRKDKVGPKITPRRRKEL